VRVFKAEEKINVTEKDLARVIGKQGLTVNTLRATLGGNEVCKIIIPAKDSKPDGKAPNGNPLWTVRIQHESSAMCKKGKKALEHFMTNKPKLQDAIAEAGLVLVKPEKKKSGGDQFMMSGAAATAGLAGGVPGQKQNQQNQQNQNQQALATQSRTTPAFGGGGGPPAISNPAAIQKVSDPSEFGDQFDLRNVKRRKVDPMDPSAYSSAPQTGGWGAGLKTQQASKHGDDVEFDSYR
jgi:hypothetical protein